MWTPPPGLCGACIHARVIESDKGSTFHQCRKALKDPEAFPKYPRLPVRSCRGFIRLRPATPDDLPAIQRIYAHWVETGVSSFEIDPPSVEEMRTRFDAVHAKQLPYLVAVTQNDEEIAGYAYATPYRPRLAYRFTVEDSIYLAPEYAGQGIGRALLEPVKAGEIEALRPYMAGPEKKRVLAAHYDAVMQLRGSVEVETLIYTLLVEAGRVDGGPVLRDLEAQRFDTVVLTSDVFQPRPEWLKAESAALPEAHIDAVRRRYRLVKHIPGAYLNGDYIYEPKRD